MLVHAHTHKVGVNRSYLASLHESVAEAGHQSSGLCFSLFALAQQHSAGFDHTCSLRTWTHSPQTRSHHVSVRLQHYWLLNHDCDEKEGAWQPVPLLSQQAWHKPSSPNFSAIDFLPACLSCRHGAGLRSPALGAALWFPWLPSRPWYSWGFAEQHQDLEAERTRLPAHLQSYAKSAGKACFHPVHREQLEEGLFSSKSA